MAGRKKFLPEDEIQGLERLGSEQLADHLSSLSHEALVKLFIRMLHSYRLAARTANAVIRYLQSTTQENHDELIRCAHDYSPNQIPRHPGDVEVLCDEFGALLEQCEGVGSAKEILHIIEWKLVAMEQLHQQIRAQVDEQLSLPARTPVK